LWDVAKQHNRFEFVQHMCYFAAFQVYRTAETADGELSVVKIAEIFEPQSTISRHFTA